MRLHRLALTAIGPYADRQEVDFDALAVGGLFLLEGPTGAGKSTVLDAVTFALYGGGDTPGEGSRLHSHYADPATTPEVCLEFSVGGVRFRISRSPAHRRRRRRGEGWVEQRAASSLSRLSDGEWQLVSTSHREIGTIVQTEVGLTRDQFTQVVVLPQGEFARFLQADDDARRAVLTRLFGAQPYEAMTRWLRDRAQGARCLQQEAQQDVVAAVAAAAEAAQLDPTAAARWRELADEPNPAASPLRHELDLTTASMATSRREAAAALAGATRAVTAAAAVLADHERAVDRLDRLVSPLEQQRDPAAQRAEQDERQRVIDAARRSLSVVPLVTAAQSAAADRDQLQQVVMDLCANEPDGTDPQALAASAREAEAAAVRLSDLAALEAGLPARHSALTASEETQRHLDADVAARRGRLAELPPELAAARRTVTTARQAEAALPALLGERDRAERRNRARSDLADLNPRLSRADSDHRSAVDRHQEAVDRLQDLQAARLRGMTAELAGRLVPGEPCGVCGAPDHPRPAAMAADPVTDADIATARADVERARAARADTESSRQDLDQAVAAAQALAGEAATDSLTDLNRRVTETSATAAGLTSAMARVTDLEAEEQDIREGLTTASAASAELAGRLAQQREQLAADRAALTTAAGEAGTVAERLAQWQRRARHLNEAAESARALQHASTAARSAVGHAEQAAVAAGFPDASAATAAALDPAVLQAETEAADTWHTVGATLTRQLADPALQGLDPASLPAARSALGEAREAHDGLLADERAAAEHAARAVDRHNRFTARCHEATAALDRRAELIGDNAAVLDLDLLARGITGDRARMTLTTFVLRLWFERVVTAANVRLAQIAGGKYELRRTEATEGRDRVGLGVTVFDRHTGRTRGPQTLSGGETFYTSLALALGLADVVQAEAGGVGLDTLFVDEGFGSLDPDTLEDVLTVIDGLRSNGRVVGIISHVQDLKDRVPERLEIRRERPDGPARLRVVA